MDVRHLIVLLSLLGLVVVVAVRQLSVVVFVDVPMCSMLPFSERTTFVVMRDVIMIMSVDLRRMDMLRLLALPLGTLLDHGN
jgi:hypothetical protein